MSPRNSQARDCQHRAWRALFVGRPIDRISDKLSLRLTTIIPHATSGVHNPDEAPAVRASKVWIYHQPHWPGFKIRADTAGICLSTRAMSPRPPWANRARDEPSPNSLRKPGTRSRCSSRGSPGKETDLQTGTIISRNRQRSFHRQSSPVFQRRQVAREGRTLATMHQNKTQFLPDSAGGCSSEAIRPRCCRDHGKISSSTDRAGKARSGDRGVSRHSKRMIF